MFKFNFKNVLISSQFWRILCEALFALGELIACIVNDGVNDFDDEPVAD